jgi:hypothetical protein
MFQFSRAIYRELAVDIDAGACASGRSAHEHVLRTCEQTMERLSADRHYFAPARTDAVQRHPLLLPHGRAGTGLACGGPPTSAPLRAISTASRAPASCPRQAAAVPRDHAQGHRLPARAPAPQRLLPVAPAPGRDRGARARRSLNAARPRAPGARSCRTPPVLLGVDVGGPSPDAVLVAAGPWSPPRRRPPRRPVRRRPGRPCTRRSPRRAARRGRSTRSPTA